MRALLLSLALWAVAAPAQQTSDTAKNRGVEAFRSGRYAEAVLAFRDAVSLRPTDPQLHLYLATALMQKWDRNNRSPANLAIAREAESEYLRVLHLAPEDHYALRALARLAQDQKRFDEAKKWSEQALVSDPTDADAYYTLGMIAWQQFYPVLTKAGESLGLKLDEEGRLTSASVRKSLRFQYSSTIEEGITNLKKAVALDSN
jgi:Flp pilus assembly protein TadD